MQSPEKDRSPAFINVAKLVHEILTAERLEDLHYQSSTSKTDLFSLDELWSQIEEFVPAIIRARIFQALSQLQNSESSDQRKVKIEPKSSVVRPFDVLTWIRTHECTFDETELRNYLGMRANTPLENHKLFSPYFRRNSSQLIIDHHAGVIGGGLHGHTDRALYEGNTTYTASSIVVAVALLALRHSSLRLPQIVEKSNKEDADAKMARLVYESFIYCSQAGQMAELLTFALHSDYAKAVQAADFHIFPSHLVSLEDNTTTLSWVKALRDNGQLQLKVNLPNSRYFSGYDYAKVLDIRINPHSCDANDLSEFKRNLDVTAHFGYPAFVLGCAQLAGLFDTDRNNCFATIISPIQVDHLKKSVLTGTFGIVDDYSHPSITHALRTQHALYEKLLDQDFLLPAHQHRTGYGALVPVLRALDGYRIQGSFSHFKQIEGSMRRILNGISIAEISEEQFFDRVDKAIAEL